MNKPKHFTVRVYGLFINERHEILLSDEFVYDKRMTKFPGGGLEFGEGTIDCLKREAIEEFGQGINIIRHFYTTDFYQHAFYLEDHQIISIYYVAEFQKPIKFEVSTKAFDYGTDKEGCQSFRWKAISSLKESDFTFPIDKHIVKLIKEQLSN